VCSVEQGQSLNKTSKERNGIQNREATKAAAPAGRYPHPLGHRPASGQCRPSAPRPPPSSRRPLPTSSPVKRLPVVVSLANTTELLMHPCGLSWRFLQPLCQQRHLPLPRPPSGSAHGSPRLRAPTGSAPGLLRPVVSFNDLTVSCMYI
jgi:hypothetical protein